MRWLITVAVLCSVARPARADLAGAIYGDVRDVVEELIQNEVTTSVVRTIERRSPALAFYMHGTLERLASPYWGSLGRVLKDDVTVAVADFVYWHLSTGGGDGDVVGSAKRFFGCAKFGPDAESAACKRLLAAIKVQRRPLLEVECRRTAPVATRRVACHVGLAVLAALKGRGEVRQHLVDALSEVVLVEVADKNVGGRMRDVLTRWLELPKDLPTPLLEALANPDLAAMLTDDALDARCADWSHIKQLVDDPTGPYSWICFAVTHKKIEPLLAATVTVKEGAHTFTQSIPHWEIEKAIRDVDADRLDDDTAYRIFAELAWDKQCPAGAGKDLEAGPCAGKRFESGAQVSVGWLRRPPFRVTLNANGKLTGAPQKFLVSPVLKFRKLTRRIWELRQAVPPSLTQHLFYAGQTVSPDTKAALRAAHRMARLVSELRARWYLWKTDKKSFEELDVAELLHVARASLDQATIEANGALAFLDKQATGGAATLDIGDWLRMVMRADFRSLAMESLRAALDLPLKTTNRPHETFFLSLSAYLLDTSEGVDEAVARSAFRASAKELLLSASHRGVPRIGDRFRFRLLPRVGVKMSFNDTYAVTDGNSRRTVVAADWPTMMLAFNDYLGLELSVFDFVAPLAEMALRPAGKYERYEYVALDLVRPRLGMWIALPQFSRRLALTAGFGARLVDVERLDDGTDPKMLHAEYGYEPSLTFDAGVQFVF